MVATPVLSAAAVILLVLAALPLAGSEQVQNRIRWGLCLAAIVLIVAAVCLLPG